MIRINGIKGDCGYPVVFLYLIILRERNEVNILVY